MPAYNSISKLGIISANVNGFGQKQKRFNFFHHIKSANPDFILLSDTRLDTLSENELRNEIDYHCVFNSFSSDRRGVAILFKKTLPIKHSIINSDNNGNLLSLEIEYDHKKFLLTAIYGPNTDRPDFFENLFELNNQVNYATLVSLMFLGIFFLTKNILLGKNLALPNEHALICLLPPTQCVPI